MGPARDAGAAEAWGDDASAAERREAVQTLRKMLSGETDSPNLRCGDSSAGDSGVVFTMEEELKGWPTANCESADL